MLPPEIWAILLYAGQMLDAYTTRIGLTTLPLEERNPIGRLLIGRYGFTGIQVLKSALAGGLFCVAGFLTGNDWLWLAMTAVSWFPVAWNAAVIHRARNA